MRAASLAWAPRSVPGWIRQEQRRGTEYLVGRSRVIYPAGELQNVIHESRSILDLPNNWDDAGSPGFRRETWERAVKILTEVASFLWAVHGRSLAAPSISPGTEGSIDLHWKTPRRELLINIPEDQEESAPYYGDDYGADKKKGAINPGSLNASLFEWLTQTA